MKFTEGQRRMVCGYFMLLAWKKRSLLHMAEEVKYLSYFVYNFLSSNANCTVMLEMWWVGAKDEVLS